MSIRHLRDFNRELAHYDFKLREKISVLRAAAEDLCEAAPSHRNWAARNQMSSKRNAPSTEAQKKEDKVKAMLHALKMMFSRRLNLQIKKTVIVLKDNNIHD